MNKDKTPPVGSDPPPGYISIKEAQKMAEEQGITTTTATMISWVEKQKLGFQPGGLNGKWYVNKEAFGRFLDGKTIGPK